MGEVYKAEHVLLKRPCAIKLIKAASEADATTIARFEKEVKATAKLTHWNTVEIYDYGRTDDGTFYYVMELLPGLSLEDMVGKYGALPPERVIHLLRQICGALQEAHSAGLIHRDIKPANIFASSACCPKSETASASVAGVRYSNCAGIISQPPSSQLKKRNVHIEATISFPKRRQSCRVHSSS